MSSDPTPAANAVPVLSQYERRILGVLVEKAKTTPDAYPLSLNALQTGCNQKSNRDPVLDLSDVDVEDALRAAQKKGLTIRITGSSRVERWKHNLYEAWKVSKTELAVLGELLLRGAQTEGELRGRASRMEPIEDLDALRVVLKPLAERRLVVYLTQPERRGTMLTHGFHDAAELERLRAKLAASGDFEAEPRTSVAEARRPEADTRLTEALGQITELRGQVAVLQSQVSELTAQVKALRDGGKT